MEKAIVLTSSRLLEDSYFNVVLVVSFSGLYLIANGTDLCAESAS